MFLDCGSQRATRSDSGIRAVVETADNLLRWIGNSSRLYRNIPNRDYPLGRRFNLVLGDKIPGIDILRLESDGSGFNGDCVLHCPLLSRTRH